MPMIKVHQRNTVTWLLLEVNPIVAFQMAKKKTRKKKKKRHVRQICMLNFRTWPDFLKQYLQRINSKYLISDTMMKIFAMTQSTRHTINTFH